MPSLSILTSLVLELWCEHTHIPARIQTATNALLALPHRGASNNVIGTLVLSMSVGGAPVMTGVAGVLLKVFLPTVCNF